MPPAPQLMIVPLDQIHTSGNIRTNLGNLTDLAASFEDGQPDQPPVVCPNHDGYNIVFGHRRVEAARMRGETHMTVLVRPAMPDQQRIMRQLVENTLREDLNPLDEARAFQDLIHSGMRQCEIARALGKSEAYVSQRLSLLQLAPPVQDAVLNAQLSASTAELLSALDLAEQARVLPLVKGKPVKQARQIVQLSQFRTQHAQVRARREEDDDYTALVDAGGDPLFIAALSELEEAQTAVTEVYVSYRLEKCDGQVRQRIRKAAQCIVAKCNAILESTGGK